MFTCSASLLFFKSQLNCTSEMPLSRNVTGREFHRHGPATKTQSNILKDALKKTEAEEVNPEEGRLNDRLLPSVTVVGSTL